MMSQMYQCGKVRLLRKRKDMLNLQTIWFRFLIFVVGSGKKKKTHRINIEHGLSGTLLSYMTDK